MTLPYFRYGGALLIASALLFAIGGVLVLLSPIGGLDNPAPGLTYYLGLVLAAPAYAAWYAALGERAGWAGGLGFVLGAMGAVGYGTAAFLVLPLAGGVEAAHDVWLYAMATVPVLPIGALAFFIGSILLGVASMRSPGMDRWAGTAVVAGFAAWTVAFFAPPDLAWLLTVANLVGGAGMAWIGWSIWSGPIRERA
ncbi:MAG TPA: hypothetical protein VF071_00170 [Candidatus Limnocylindria bacterium]